jgi:hypothetical protein
MIADTILGGIIAFLCAAVAVGTDAQTEVRARFGRLYGTSILRTWAAYVFVIGWGIVNVCFYVVFLFNHEWAKRAFNVEVDQNLPWTGLIVGFSAVLLIRTNLATVGSVQIGGEYVYTWSRSFLIDRLNRARARMRLAFLQPHRRFCRDITSYPNYFRSLETDALMPLAAGSAQREEILTQLAAIKASVADHEKDGDAREDLTKLVYDYFGPADVESWATATDHGNK